MVVNVSLQKESARPQIHTTYTGSANISTSLYCQAKMPGIVLLVPSIQRIDMQFKTK